jgi:chondroitin AC lyase
LKALYTYYLKFVYRLVVPVCLILVQSANAQPTQVVMQANIDTLSNRLIKLALNETAPGKVDSLAKNIQADGSWNDINYKDGVHVQWTWHSQRLKQMAIAFNSPQHKRYHDANLLKAIVKGFDFIYNKKYISWNWYDTDIAAPSNYMVALILLKNKIPDDQLLKYATYLKDATDNKAHQGQNRISVSIITVYKGCIENNYALIAGGFTSIASTLVVESKQGAEGIKVDDSFHQHRPQLYSGGYGMAFVKSIARLMALTANTTFAAVFSPEKRRLFSGLMLNGHQLFGYRNTIDFGTIGRGISRPNSMNNVDNGTLSTMMAVDPAHAADYKAWRDHLNSGPYPSKYQGNKYFWKSDIMTHHGADYYLSAKVISTRTAGTEMLNGENAKGFNLPLGATNIATTGKEYYNIFPVWDWTKVPGTTSVNNESSTLLSWYQYGSNVFSGGVSNGKNGLIAYEHSYNGVQAKKAYFFMDNAMLCLGAGINALGVQSVQTTINQCFLNGDVTVNAGSIINKLTGDSQAFADLKWIYHDGVGYIFPGKANITVRKAVQQGTWKSLNVTGSDTVVKLPVFSAWLNHGTGPTNQQYAYIVMPAKSLETFKAEAAIQKFVINQNTPDVQAVSYKNYYGIVFYEPGTVTLTDGLSITCNSKATVMIERKPQGYTISVADPIHRQEKIKLVINKKVTGKYTQPLGKGTAINFTLPTGDYMGSTLTQNVQFLKSK